MRVGDTSIRILGAAVALVLAAPAAATAETRSAACEGPRNRCAATFSLDGLRAGDRLRLVVRLPDTDLELRAISASHRSVRRAYALSDISQRLGGSELTAELGVIDRMPGHAALTLRFAVPPAMRDCGDLRFRIDQAVVRLGDVQARGLTCASARRVARRCTSGVGPGPRWRTILEIDRMIVLRRRGARVTFVLRNETQSCAPSG